MFSNCFKNLSPRRLYPRLNALNCFLPLYNWLKRISDVAFPLPQNDNFIRIIPMNLQRTLAINMVHFPCQPASASAIQQELPTYFKSSNLASLAGMWTKIQIKKSGITCRFMIWQFYNYLYSSLTTRYNLMETFFSFTWGPPLLRSPLVWIPLVWFSTLLVKFVLVELAM